MAPLTVASWNVNSLRVRLERVLAWLQEKQPDVLCLQEIKLEEPLFPAAEFRAAGYHGILLGQKSYNGVALLSRQEHGAPEAVSQGLQDGDPDPSARLIGATIPGLGVRVYSVYVPNGQTVPSDKFDYKLRWLGRLRSYLDRCCDPQAPLLLCGDFNVAPDDRDVYDPEGWKETVICHPDARRALEQVVSFGLHDALRLVHPEAGLYTYWDYRMLSFPKNRGLRIDHIFCTKPLAERVREVTIDRQARKGKQPSDHAPIIASFH